MNSAYVIAYSNAEGVPLAPTLNHGAESTGTDTSGQDVPMDLAANIAQETLLTPEKGSSTPEDGTSKPTEPSKPPVVPDSDGVTITVQLPIAEAEPTSKPLREANDAGVGTEMPQSGNGDSTNIGNEPGSNTDDVSNSSVHTIDQDQSSVQPETSKPNVTNRKPHTRKPRKNKPTVPKIEQGGSYPFKPIFDRDPGHDTVSVDEHHYYQQNSQPTKQNRIRSPRKKPQKTVSRSPNGIKQIFSHRMAHSLQKL